MEREMEMELAKVKPGHKEEELADQSQDRPGIPDNASSCHPLLLLLPPSPPPPTPPPSLPPRPGVPENASSFHPLLQLPPSPPVPSRSFLLPPSVPLLVLPPPPPAPTRSFRLPPTPAPFRSFSRSPSPSLPLPPFPSSSSSPSTSPVPPPLGLTPPPDYSPSSLFSSYSSLYPSSPFTLSSVYSDVVRSRSLFLPFSLFLPCCFPSGFFFFHTSFLPFFLFHTFPPLLPPVFRPYSYSPRSTFISYQSSFISS